MVPKRAKRGVDATREVTARMPVTKVLVLTIAADDEHIMDAMMAGAAGYLLKDSSVEELVGAQLHSFVPDTPAGKVRSEEVHRRHLAGASIAGWELEMRRKDGEVSDAVLVG